MNNVKAGSADNRQEVASPWVFLWFNVLHLHDLIDGLL